MSKIKKIFIAITIGGITGLVIVTGIFLLKLSIHGTFPPGTNIGGIDISYKTPLEAEKILLQAREKYLKTPLEITLENTTKNFTPQELGIDILVDKTIQVIEETDATEISPLELVNFFREKKGAAINVLTTIDYRKAILTINEEFNLNEIAPHSATFYFDENNKLAIREGKNGLALDRESFFKDLKNSAKQLTPQKIMLSLEQEGPEITKGDLEKQIESIKESLRHEFVLIDPVYSDDWYMKLTDHLDWVVFTEKENIDFSTFPEIETEKIAAIEIKQEKLNEFIDAEISKWLDVPPEPVNIYTNEDGEVIIEGKGGDGLEVQREHLKKAIELAVANKIRDVPIPVLKISPKITVSEDLRELGIKDRLGIGHSSYYNSPKNRVHNIKVGASKFNGKLIGPGETFSFNKNLGRVDASTGYKKELVIKEEGTLPEYGGGICQVSTTMYRAALFSGLPMVERNEHSYAVSYYSQVLGHGLDATVYLGGADLKFKNDTSHHILIQTYTKDDYELFIIFYGTSDGRTVELEGPYLSNYHNPGPTIYVDTTEIPVGEKKQVEKAHTGFNALWYRYISYPNSETEIESIKTHYRAIPAKIWVGVEKIEGEKEKEE